MSATKPYFTKYLPDKGEPNLGHPCFVQGKLCKVYTEYHWREWAGHETYGTGINPIMAATLFICTKATCKECGGTGSVMGDSIAYFVNDVDCDKCNGTGIIDKVIGKVSTAALLYVKEGQEFDKKDLLQQGSGVNLTTNGGFVKIKCPWGHFH